MAKIVLIQMDRIEPKYTIRYRGKKYKNGSEIVLEEDSFIDVKEKGLRSIKFFYVLYLICLFIAGLLSSSRLKTKTYEAKKINLIRVNYNKVIADEVIISVDNNYYVEVKGLELISVVFNGEKLSKL